MDSIAEARPPVGIVYDSDFGHSIDTALALALLYGFDGKKEARVVSISVSNQNLKAAQLADVISRFYAFRNVPIGLYADGKWTEDTALCSTPLAMRKDDGTPVFPSSIEKLNDTADPVALIRNAMTAQHDQNCVIVVAGPVTNLAATLALHGVKDIIVSKVRLLVATEVPSKEFLDRWPTPIVIAPAALGSSVLYPASSIEKDFSWSSAHPVVEAYRAYKPMPYDATTTSMAAALYAVHPDANYFKVSEPVGRMRTLSADPSQKDAILKVYTELVSAKPVPKKFPGPPKVDAAK
jgi:hypothetical protein